MEIHYDPVTHARIFSEETFLREDAKIFMDEVSAENYIQFLQKTIENLEDYAFHKIHFAEGYATNVYCFNPKLDAVVYLLQPYLREIHDIAEDPSYIVFISNEDPFN